ncbi:MAG: helicase, partial [Lachnospiraceae bacterium]|nr:helicase [Lachnospiraceae bacterium]
RVARKKGEGQGSLTPERIRELEEIGMVWDVPAYQWEKNYASAKRYYQTYGDLDVPSAYVDEEGISLGAWIRKMRRAKKEIVSGRIESEEMNPMEKAALSQEQARRLELIGMKWEPKREAAWERSYTAACEYRKEYGSLEVPVSFTARNGIRLGKWVRRQREAYQTGSISRERMQKLEEIGMLWQVQDRRNK